MPSDAVNDLGGNDEGMSDGFMRAGEALGGFRGTVLRCFMISRSSKSEPTSEMLPSEGSLSISLSLTSSMRACDIAAAIERREKVEVGLEGFQEIVVE